MVQLWFSTSIPWITKPTEVVAEAKKPIPVIEKKKTPFPADKIKLASTSMVWLVNPKREDEKQVTNAAYEIAKATVTGSWFDSVMENYYNTLSDQWFEDARNIASDLVSWSWANEMATAYKTKWFTPEEIKDVHYWFSLLQWNNITEWIWEITDTEWNWMWIWTIAWMWAWAIAWMWATWKLLKSAGKYIYKNIGWISETVPQALAMKEWKTDAQKMFNINPEWASTKEIRTTPQTALEKWGIFKQTWWNITRATTAKQTARRIRTKEIAPILQKIWWTIWLNDIKKEAGKLIKEMPNIFSANAYSEWVKEVINTLKNTKFKWVNIYKLSAEKLQDLRSYIMKMDIPKSAFRWTEVKESFKQGAIAVIDAIKSILKKWVEKIWENVDKFDKAYSDYWNLVDMAETMAKKAWTIPSQNLQQMLSSWTGKPLSAISTFAGKLLYKIWKWLEIPLDVLVSIAKWWVKVLKKVVKWWNVFSMLEDWSIIPWSPTNIYNRVKEEYKNMSKEDKKQLESWWTIISL